MSETRKLRIAIAQSTVRQDPRDAEGLRESGREVRALMREAAAADARLVLFTEGATCFPHKGILSSTGPDEIGPADWSRVDWAALRAELTATAALAGELGLWTVLGSVHRLTPPHRPHNSLYVIDDRGAVVTRYDERLLSHTKVSHMYAPGTAPRTFDVDGVRFGLALGIEVHFPEVFTEYERLDVDCVLFATTGGTDADGPLFATEAQGHAAANGYWLGFATPAGYSPFAAAGLIGPHGQWLARCPADGTPALAVAELDQAAEEVAIAVGKARPWRRAARDGLHAPHRVTDARSADLTAF